MSNLQTLINQCGEIIDLEARIAAMNAEIKCIVIDNKTLASTLTDEERAMISGKTVPEIADIIL